MGSMRVRICTRDILDGVRDKERVRSSAGVAANTRRDDALALPEFRPSVSALGGPVRCGNGSECRCRSLLPVQHGHLIMTKTLTTRFSSLVDTGSVTYCSMNMSFASSRVSARNLVIAS